MDKSDSGQDKRVGTRTVSWHRVIGSIRSFTRGRAKIYRLWAAVMVTAFLLGRVSVIGESAPFGIGFFAAVFAYSSTWAGGVLICVLVGALTIRELGDVLLLVAAALFIWQGSIRWGRKRRAVRIPLLCGASLLAVGWSYQFLIGGSLYDGMIVLLSAGLASLFAALVLYGIRVFGQCERPDGLMSEQVQEGFLALVSVLALAVSGIGELTIADHGLQMAAGCLLSLVLLMVTELGVALAGCIGLGFVIGVGDGNVSMTMAEYAMAGLIGGALKSRGKGGCIIGFLAGLGGMLLCFDPYGALWYMMSDAMVGAGVFLLIPIRYLRQLRQYLEETTIRDGSELRIQALRDKLCALKSLFLYMADVGVTDGEGTVEEDRQGQTAALLAAVEETACTVCEKRKHCWEEDFFAVSQEMLNLLGDSDSQKRVRETFGDRCPSAEAITKTLEKTMREQSQSRYWKMQCGIQQSVLTEQMRSLGEIFRQMEEELLPRKDLYREKRQRIVKRLTAWGCIAEEVTIDEENGMRIEVSCPSCGGNRICEERFLPYLERVLAMRLRMSVMCGAQNRLRQCRLYFTMQERIRILTGMVGFGRTQGEESGDTCEMLTVAPGKTVVLLSDGMGCGQTASRDSRETVCLMKKLLSAGFGGQAAVQTVNALLSLRAERERFATVDVLLIDRYTGEADFIKVGAPSAFIKRQSEVIVVKNDSLPLGIVKRLAVPPIHVRLEDGDFVVMMSDGVLDIPIDRIPNGHTKESWVRSQIRLFSHKSPQALAEHIAQMAIRLSGRRIHDDMTVVALKIKTVSRTL